MGEREQRDSMRSSGTVRNAQEAPDLQSWLPDRNDADGPSLVPVGHVEGLAGDPPHPAHWSEVEATIVLDPDLAPGLDGIEAFSHAFVLYWLHEADQVVLHHIPPQDADVTLGVFASRCPLRPNAIGLSVVEILDRDGAKLKVRGLDARDGTPVLDVKPYAPRLDAIPDARDLRSVLDEKGAATGQDPESGDDA